MTTATGTIATASSTLWGNDTASFTGKLLETRRNEIKAFSIALKDEHFLKFIATSEGDEAFSELVGLAVREYGVSQREIATATDSTPSTVSRWMSGNSMPPRFTRKSIVEAIGMVIDHNLDI